MKKIIAVIICVSLLAATMFTLTLAEDGDSIVGLQESLNTIWLKSNDNAELIKTMKDSYANFIENKISSIMSAPDYAREKIPLTGSYDNQVQQIRDMYKLDFDRGFLLTDMIGSQYAETYANALSFDYLFTGEEYWLIPYESKKSFMCFDVQGNYLQEDPITRPSNALADFVLGEDNVNTLLKNANIKNVDKMKVFAFTRYDVLIYIRSDMSEFVLRFPSSNTKYEELQGDYFKSNTLYNAKEAMSGLANIGAVSGYASFKVDAPKSSFNTEAEFLQAEGLLNGNEKGLDLLKPLTRIEAAAMLLRAIGEPETAPNSIQTFSDVPKTYWGYGAVERAASEGIVNGVGDGKFSPDKTVTATEFATMVLRTSDTGEFDWQNALNMLIEKGIITQENADTMDLFTRGDMAKIIYEGRKKGLL